MLTGKVPFEGRDIPTLIHKHIAEKPVNPSQIKREVDPALDKIVMKMLSKDPEDRYQSELGIITDLKKYLDWRRKGIKGVDFEIGKSDRLRELTYRTHLIGRDEELEKLKVWINNLRECKGKVIFISGKAGSGKTRLVNELRRYAYTRNILFISGKCYRAPVKEPYYVLREALEEYIERIKRLPYALRIEKINKMRQILGQLGKEIEKITSKIVEILGEQPPLVKLEPQKEKIRFLVTVSNFLTKIADKNSPLIIFLDDLQWVDEASLEIIKEVAEKIENSSLLLIGAYREEEVSIDRGIGRVIKELEKKIEIGRLKLENLNEEQTRKVISGILQEEEGKIKELAFQIYLHTGGNPFFIVELLHTLIDKGTVYYHQGHYLYKIEDIKKLDLPANVVDLLILRIERLSEITIKVLSYAATLGKKFYLEDLIKILKFMDKEEIVRAVKEGEREQILTHSYALREEILFIHDRVREAFYKKLPQEERIQLNQKIAQSIEKQNRDNLDKVIFELAYHYWEGKVEDKALEYSYKAAKRAQNDFAYQEAIDFYLKVKKILEKKNRQATWQYRDTLENLGEVYRLRGKFDDSFDALYSCLKLIKDEEKLYKAKIYSKIGDTLFEKGEVEEAIQWYIKGLKILKVRVPSSKIGVILKMLKEFIVQIFHMYFPIIFVSQQYKPDPLKILISRIYSQLGRCYYFSDMNKAFHASLSSLNLAEKIGPSRELASAYYYIACMWTVFPWFTRTFRDIYKSITVAKSIQDKLAEGSAYAYMVYVSWVANRLELGLEYAQKSISLLRELGEYWNLGVAFTFRTAINMSIGDFKKTLYECEEHLTSALEVKLSQSIGWALFLRGLTLSFIGKVDEKVIEDLKQAYKLMEETRDFPNVMYTLAILSFAYLRRNKYKEAIETIEKAIDMFPAYHNKVPWVYALFSIGAQIYYEFLKNNPHLSKRERDYYLRRMYYFCKQALRWLGVYKHWSGWELRVYANYFYLRNKRRKAVKILKKAIKSSQKYGHKYQMGMCYYDLGSYLLEEEITKEEGRRYLEQARQIFKECTAELDLYRTEKLLGIKKEDEGKVETTTLTLAERSRELSLLEVSHLISSILDLEPLLKKILEISIKITGAERGFLLLYNEKTGKLELELASVEEYTDKKIDFGRLKISPRIISFVEERRKGVMYPSVTKEAQMIEEAETVKFYGIKSVICAPLIRKDKLLGMIYLDSSLAKGVFDMKDMETLQTISVQAAISIENARLFKTSQEKIRLEQEMNTARQIQKSLLPQKGVKIGDVEIEGLMLPALEVAGDYYDFIEYGVNKVGVVVADVSGKGLDSGMVMSMVKSTLMPLTTQELSPKEIVIRLNKFLCKQLKQQKFVSLIYGEYDVDSNVFRWAGAGQEYLIIYKGEGEEPEVIKAGGVVLGMFEDIDENIVEREIKVGEKEKIILYTDGVTEAGNLEGVMYGLNRFLDIIKKAPEMKVKEFLGYIKNHIEGYIQNVPQYDDITVVVLERQN